LEIKLSAVHSFTSKGIQLKKILMAWKYQSLLFALLINSFLMIIHQVKVYITKTMGMKCAILYVSVLVLLNLQAFWARTIQNFNSVLYIF
jgi:hypothetical protein